MSYLINNQQKLNDVVFAHRNKNYGAYAIRSAYGNTMLKSLICMIFGFGTLVSIAWYASNRPDLQEEITGQVLDQKIYTIPVDLNKEKKPEIPAAGKPSQKDPGKKTNALTTNVTVNDSVAVETKHEPGAVTQNSIAEKPDTGESNETGSGNEGKKSDSSGTVNTISIVRGNYEVDAMPEFEGGLAALYKFLSSRLRYPEIAIERGVQGTVFVKFVVDEKGKIGNISLQNNLGYGLDDEARRVVSMIPAFKSPARINGEAVKVYYQLPIRFNYK
ncbi:MAG TPA: TonB family protein [Bacteroidia bacterium]|nr:TonB family protein [Bacteroidia bacterium]